MQTMTSPSPGSSPTSSPACSPGLTSRPRSWLREGAALLTFMGLVLTTRSSLADHYQVPTGSMIPTIQIGDRVVVNKLAYGLRLPFTDLRLVDFAGPRPGDVAVLRSPENGDTLIKRVVAVPGDEVAVRGGRLFIDGRPVPMREVKGRLVEVLGGKAHGLSLEYQGGPDFGPVQLGDDDYLVMGDNRGGSQDGRSFGLVGRQAFFGRALGVYWRGGPSWTDL
jgi:signal peptidase I